MQAFETFTHSLRDGPRSAFAGELRQLLDEPTGFIVLNSGRQGGNRVANRAVPTFSWEGPSGRAWKSYFRVARPIPY